MTSKRRAHIQLLSPMIDIIFKILFGIKGAEDRLISLLTAVLQPKVAIESVKILNPDIPKKQLNDKGVILDIHAKLQDGSVTDVEMQVGNEHFLFERAAYYLARITSNQIQKGDGYGKVKPSVVIFFLANDYFHDNKTQYHYDFSMKEKNNGAQFKNLLNIHIIEIGKYIRSVKDAKTIIPQNDLQAWLHFLYNPADPRLKEVYMNKPVLKKTRKHLETLSDDAETRELARMRDDWERLYKSNMEGSYQKGIEKGIEQGIEKGVEQGIEKGEKAGRLAILHNLLRHLNSKYSHEELSKITGLSIEEVTDEIKKIAE